MAVNNAFLKFKDDFPNDSTSSLEFRKAVIKEWQTGFITSRGTKKTEVHSTVKNLQSKLDCEIVNTHKSNRCHYCAAKGINKKTIYKCKPYGWQICPECLLTHFRDQYLSNQ